MAKSRASISPTSPSDLLLDERDERTDSTARFSSGAIISFDSPPVAGDSSRPSLMQQSTERSAAIHSAASATGSLAVAAQQPNAQAADAGGTRDDMPSAVL